MNNGKQNLPTAQFISKETLLGLRSDMSDTCAVGKNKPLPESNKNPKLKRLITAEDGILEATKAVCLAMEYEGYNVERLAKKIGKSNNAVSKMLQGNLSVRSLADMLGVMGYGFKITLIKKDSK